MSDVSKTNDLIARLRNQSTEIGDRADVQDLMEEAAAALGARQVDEAALAEAKKQLGEIQRHFVAIAGSGEIRVYEDTGEKHGIDYQSSVWAKRGERMTRELIEFLGEHHEPEPCCDSCKKATDLGFKPVAPQESDVRERLWGVIADAFPDLGIKLDGLDGVSAEAITEIRDAILAAFPALSRDIAGEIEAEDEASGPFPDKANAYYDGLKRAAEIARRGR